MADKITFKEALAIIDSGQYFDIRFITCDLQKGTGGEQYDLQRVCKYKNHSHAQQKALASAQPVTKNKKNPNHYENSTRNLKLENGQMVKVHIRLIRRINGKTVL
jgi:hypothetical protein